MMDMDIILFHVACAEPALQLQSNDLCSYKSSRQLLCDVPVSYVHARHSTMTHVISTITVGLRRIYIIPTNSIRTIGPPWLGLSDRWHLEVLGELLGVLEPGGAPASAAIPIAAR